MSAYLIRSLSFSTSSPSVPLPSLCASRSSSDTCALSPHQQTKQLCIYARRFAHFHRCLSMPSALSLSPSLSQSIPFIVPFFRSFFPGVSCFSFIAIVLFLGRGLCLYSVRSPTPPTAPISLPAFELIADCPLASFVPFPPIRHSSFA